MNQAPMEAQKKHSLLWMLICLTSLFIAAQLSLFYIHYRVSELIDSFVGTSIGNALHYPTITLPIIFFVTLQLFAYAIILIFTWFNARATATLFHLTEREAYLLGLFLWATCISLILILNSTHYPRSFFAFGSNNTLLVTINITILMITSITAFLGCLLKKQYRRTGTFLALTILLIAGLCIQDRYFSTLPLSPQHQQPNVILIGLDSIRPDFISYFNGRVHTPNIDKFLASASVFTNTYTPLARTFPSWVSILTARYPKHHHARWNLIDPNSIDIQDTLAKRLQAAGFETLFAMDEARFANIREQYGFNHIIGPRHGVAEFILGGLTDFPLTNLLVNTPIGKYLMPYQYGNRAANITYQPDSFLSLVKDGIRKHNPNKPLFLAVHLCLSHWPYVWSESIDADTSIPLQYQASLETIDQQFANLLHLLQQAGLLDHSLVVLLSDHGTALGLPNDRLINIKNYVGDKKLVDVLQVWKLSSANENSLNFKRDFTISTSHGQGTDVLSLQQTHILLGFRGYHLNLPPAPLHDRHTTLEIAPSVLDLLQLPPLIQADGTSFFHRQTHSNNIPYFIETGDRVTESETDHIDTNKVIAKAIGAYQINADTGALSLKQIERETVINSKERAVLYGDWLLAQYPAEYRLLLTQHGFKAKYIPPYYILANVKSGKWTIGLSSPLAKQAPVQKLYQQLHQFYGNELQPLGAKP